MTPNERNQLLWGTQIFICGFCSGALVAFAFVLFLESLP